MDKVSPCLWYEGKALEDPWLEHMLKWGQQDLQPHQDKAIAAAAKLVDNIK